MKNNYLLNIKNNRYIKKYTDKVIFTLLYFIPVFRESFIRKMIKKHYFNLKLKYEK